MPDHKKSLCPCCNQLLTASTIRRHRKQGPSIAVQISAYAKDPYRMPFPLKPDRKVKPTNFSESSHIHKDSPIQTKSLFTDTEHVMLMANSSSIFTSPKASSASDSDIELHSDTMDPTILFEPERSSTPESMSMSIDDTLEQYEQELINTLAQELSSENSHTSLDDTQLNNVLMFSMQHEGHFSRQTTELLAKYFGDKLQFTSQHRLEAQIQVLSGLKPQYFDCCINSCVGYTDKFANNGQCPKCKHPRYRSDSKPFVQFQYLPLIPRLQAYYGNLVMIENLTYRTARESNDNEYVDIFDGLHYRNLLQKEFQLDGCDRPFRIFKLDTDIALGLSGDGIRVFKHRQDSVWPFVLINYSLSPEIRTRLPYLIPLMLVPGPHSPKDHNSFLYPFYLEMIELAHGVPTYHVLRKEKFTLHAYLLTTLGDMQAFKANQYIKGPNAFSPCRACRIQGCRDTEARGTNYYYPLVPPPGTVGFEKSQPKRWDPQNLPMRTNKSYQQSLSYILQAATSKERARRSITQGIIGESILVGLPGFDRSISGPHDYMHLVDENIEKMLVNLWTGETTFLDESFDGPELYYLGPELWNLIGTETKESSKTIPAYFIRSIPNIALEKNLFIAETWAFWFTYMAPHQLKGRLPNPYYSHLLDLVNIIKCCMQLSITHEEIDLLEKNIIGWIEKYEKLYYQYKKERLATCTSCFHAFLHIPSDIRQTGPVWVNWIYFMERFAGWTVTTVRSRRFPNSALNKRLLHRAQLSQIAIKYDLIDILEKPRKPQDELSSHEAQYPEAPLSIFGRPCDLRFTPDAALRRKIAVHLTTEFKYSVPFLMARLPISMIGWDKVRIVNGDHIRVAANRENINGRDQSFVRYDLSVDKYSSQRKKESVFETRCFYGMVHKLIVCQLPPLEPFSNSPCRRFFALVQHCETNGKDATKELVTFSEMSQTNEIIELTAISCAIGRVKVGTSAHQRWGIIDRSNDLMRPSFVEDQNTSII